MAVNKGQWLMLGMAGASGGGAPSEQSPGEREKRTIWIWERSDHSYTVGHNGGGNPNRYPIDDARNFSHDDQAGIDAYVEQIKRSSSSVDWTVMRETEIHHPH